MIIELNFEYFRDHEMNLLMSRVFFLLCQDSTQISSTGFETLTEMTDWFLLKI